MHAQIIQYKLMKPIEKTIHSQNDGFKTQTAVYLGVVIAFLIINSHRIETS